MHGEHMTQRIPERVFILLLISAGLAVYAGSFCGPFIFDDKAAIVENPNIRQLWPLTRALGWTPYVTIASRPIVHLSLAFNYALGGLSVWG